jgi:prolipoprotein diacylglyceryltransferase
MLHIPGLGVHLGPVTISVHLLFESLAYTTGFLIYRRQKLLRGDVIGTHERNTVLVAAIVGAAIGSKLLAWAGDPVLRLRQPLSALLAGKTIVGGLLGGTLAVESVKKRLAIVERTGDLFAIPLATAIAIGRIGCFLGGVADRTYGTPTSLPWAVDFGDGIGRHPVQLYEIAFLAMLTWALSRLDRGPHEKGALYRLFLVSYLAWRFAVDFLKPEPAFAGLSAIQWTCVAALVFYTRDTARMFSASGRLALHG